jgi:CelD/BcsL family acetyltransferase involved in cellulose biosynthesis
MTVPDLSVEHIDVENGFNGDFIEEWKRLLEEGESKNPFSDPDWLLAWWNIYGKDYEPFILAVRTGYKLAGVLPLIKKGRKSYGNITFMGYPQATHSDIAARPENIPAVVFAALDFMCELKGNLYISLPGLRQGSAFCDAVEKYVEQKNMIFCEASVPSPVIRVDSSDFQAFCRNRFSSRAMKNNRRSESRLAFLGEVTIRSLDQSEMDAAFGLHDKRWRKKLDTSGFTSDKSKQLFTRLLSLSNSRWHAKALGLFVSGRLIAFQYGFIYGSKYALLYKSAHDDAFKAFAPGKMIKREFIRQSIEASLNVVDLGIGYEDYKAEYTDDQVIIKHIILSKDSFVRRILSRIPFSTVTWKGKLKRNRHIVLFKRNTLGEIRYALSLIWFRDSLDRIARTAKVRGFGTYLLNKCFPLKKKSLYIKKTGRNEPVSDVHVRMAGSADIEFLSILMGCAEERIVKKFYESAKCYIAEKDGAILCALWSLTINNKTVISDFCQNRHTCSKTDIICLLKFVLNKHQGCSSATVSYNRSDKILSEAIVQAGLGETEDLPENDRAKATGATAV